MNTKEYLAFIYRHKFLGKPYWWTDFPPVIQIDTNNHCGPAYCKLFCEYCHGEGTPILTADFKWKPIEQIELGDYLVGFQVKNGRWGYTPSKVLNKFSRMAETVEIVTDKGSTVCTSDHKWMVPTSHKYPYRQTRDVKKIRFISEPTVTIDDEEYRLGWLNGILRGDGCVNLYTKKRLRGVHTHLINNRQIELYHRKEGAMLIHGRAHSRWHNPKYMKANRNDYKGFFRLAVKDIEIINRFKQYVPFEVTVAGFKGTREPMTQLYSCRKANYEAAVKYETDWHENDNFNRGFLAGIFDAEGSFSGSTLRITNSDKRIIEDTAKALTRFHFKFSIEKYKPNIDSLRLLNGLSEVMRFLTLTGPCVTRKLWTVYNHTLYGEDAIVSQIIPYGLRKVYNLTTSTGNYVASGMVSKNCKPQDDIVRGVRKFAEMPMEWIEWIVKNMAKYGQDMNFVAFFLNGDGLTEPRLHEICRLSKQHAPKLRTQTFTNGSIPENAGNLIDKNLDWVCFTLSAHTPELYAKVHRGARFHDVLKTIHYVEENKLPNQKTEVHLVITETNFPYVQEWWDFIGEEFPGLERVISPLVASYDNVPSTRAMGNLTLEVQEKRMVEVGGEKAKFWKHDTLSLRQPCVLWNNFSIDVSGAVLQCCNWADPFGWNYGFVPELMREGRNLRDVWLERLANRMRNPLCRSCNMKHPDWQKRLDNMHFKCTLDSKAW